MWDLTQPVTDGMPTVPGDPPVSVTPAATVEQDGYAVSRLHLGSHAGTHVDAPAHVFADRRTLGEYAVDRFVFEAVVVDCRDLSARDPIPLGRVPPADAGDCVVFHTGWDAHWGTDRYLDHPYLSPAAGRACRDRGLAVGIDALSPDPTPTDRAGPEEPSGLPAHEAILGAEHLIVENLRNLSAVSARVELRALPLAFDGDAAPVRAVGVPVDDD